MARKNKKDNSTYSKDKIKEQQQQYRDDNKDKVAELSKVYHKNHRAELLEYKKEYKKNNKEKINEYYKYKKLTDPLFKISGNMRSIIRGAFRNNGYTKTSKSHEILGCSFEELKKHLESQFEPWMSWDNYALYDGNLNTGWDVDHIEPLNPKGIERTEEDIIRLNHYTNLRPLCSYTNRHIKRNLT